MHRALTTDRQIFKCPDIFSLFQHKEKYEPVYSYIFLDILNNYL